MHTLGKGPGLLQCYSSGFALSFLTVCPLIAKAIAVTPLTRIPDTLPTFTVGGRQHGVLYVVR